jgi:hypothetical protein
MRNGKLPRGPHGRFVWIVRFALPVAIVVASIARADWPRAEGPVPIVSMRVHAVFCSDDNGGRQTDITPTDVQAWVNKANEIYAGANVHFDFDPSSDWEAINSTLINSLSGVEQSDWIQARDAANAVAAGTPHDLVALFRWGPGTSPTGGGFSWTDYNFVAMPAFDVTTVCGHQNIGLFAHEAGHYLGLAHTFGPTFSTVAQAQTYFVNNGRNPLMFDGDGRADTYPDPYVSAVQCNTSVTSLTLGGTVFPLPRSNIMTYYEPRSDLAPSQAATVRQTLLLRSGQNLTQLVSDSPGQVLEAESYQPTVTGGVAFNQNMSGFLGRWSGDNQVFWIDGGAGEQLSFDFQVNAAGTYDIYGGFTAAPDYGVFTHVINGQPGQPLDLYSRGVLPTGAVYLGQYDLNSGENEWLVETSGTNPLASPVRYGYGLDYMLLVPVPEPIPGDTNGDGHVDQTDAATVATHWGMSGMSWSDGDFNGDGVVNAADASILAANWGHGTSEAGAVPEPGVIMLVVALGGFVMAHRRREQASAPPRVAM